MGTDRAKYVELKEEFDHGGDLQGCHANVLSKETIVAGSCVDISEEVIFLVNKMAVPTDPPPDLAEEERQRWHIGASVSAPWQWNARERVFIVSMKN